MPSFPVAGRCHATYRVGLYSSSSFGSVNSVNINLSKAPLPSPSPPLIFWHRSLCAAPTHATHSTPPAPENRRPGAPTSVHDRLRFHSLFCISSLRSCQPLFCASTFASPPLPSPSFIAPLATHLVPSILTFQHWPRCLERRVQSRSSGAPDMPHFSPVRYLGSNSTPNRDPWHVTPAISAMRIAKANRAEQSIEARTGAWKERECEPEARGGKGSFALPEVDGADTRLQKKRKRIVQRVLTYLLRLQGNRKTGQHSRSSYGQQLWTGVGEVKVVELQVMGRAEGVGQKTGRALLARCKVGQYPANTRYLGLSGKR